MGTRIFFLETELAPMKNFLIVVQFSIYLKIQFVGNPSTGTIARYVGYLVLVYGIIEIVPIDSYENRIV